MRRSEAYNNWLREINKLWDNYSHGKHLKMINDIAKDVGILPWTGLSRKQQKYLYKQLDKCQTHSWEAKKAGILGNRRITLENFNRLEVIRDVGIMNAETWYAINASQTRDESERLIRNRKGAFYSLDDFPPKAES